MQPRHRRPRHDPINVTGDVTADIFTRELEGFSGAVDHLVTSDDPSYDGLPVDGLDLNVATGTGATSSSPSLDGFTITEGGLFALTAGPALVDKYFVRLAVPADLPGVRHRVRRPLAPGGSRRCARQPVRRYRWAWRHVPGRDLRHDAGVDDPSTISAVTSS